MFNIIERYMERITKEDVRQFALKKDCHLSEEELDFTYTFIKKNWKDIIKNPQVFNIDRYKERFSEENFKKVKQVYTEYFQQFSSLL